MAPIVFRNWVDARFFREVYNAENVLNELSDQVRTMVQPQSLLETVVTRISETLHVSRIAVLLDSGSPFRPVYAIGYGEMPQLQFAPSAGSVKLLKTEKEPLRVYPDDENSWLYREENVTAKERDELHNWRGAAATAFVARQTAGIHQPGTQAIRRAIYRQ